MWWYLVRDYENSSKMVNTEKGLPLPVVGIIVMEFVFVTSSPSKMP